MIPPARAMFIQLRRIGDVLMCTPAIRAFKSRYPDCELDFLTELPAVLSGNPHLKKIQYVDRSKAFDIVYQIRLLKAIRNRQYDIIVDFFANPRSAYYSFLSGAPIRLSYGYGHRKWAYNMTPVKSPEPTYAALDRLNLLKEAGVESNDPRLDFYISNSEREFARRAINSVSRGPLISLSPVSRREFNRWPIDNYARLADSLIREFDANVILLAGPGEESIAAEVARLMKGRPMIPHINSLGELGAILERVSFHIGNDNGPKHIAVAMGAPTLTVYGPHNNISWTYPDISRHFWIAPDEFCEDCRLKRHRRKTNCITLIPMEKVWDKVSTLADTVLKNAPRP
jgi:ADP-heptose:LPS heptosyltransferase